MLHQERINKECISSVSIVWVYLGSVVDFDQTVSDMCCQPRGNIATRNQNNGFWQATHNSTYKPHTTACACHTQRYLQARHHNVLCGCRWFKPQSHMWSWLSCVRAGSTFSRWMRPRSWRRPRTSTWPPSSRSSRGWVQAHRAIFPGWVQAHRAVFPWLADIQIICQNCVAVAACCCSHVLL